LKKKWGVSSFSKLQTCIQYIKNNNKNRKYIKIEIKKLKVSKTWTKVTEGHGHPLVLINYLSIVIILNILKSKLFCNIIFQFQKMFNFFIKNTLNYHLNIRMNVR